MPPTAEQVATRRIEQEELAIVRHAYAKDVRATANVDNARTIRLVSGDSPR